MSADRPRLPESRVHAAPAAQLDFATLRSLPARGRRQFRQRDCGRFGQNLVAALIDIAKAEHDRLGFIFGEHGRRQEETGPQHVTNPRLAIDGSALGDEVGDVPIKCALGNPSSAARADAVTGRLRPRSVCKSINNLVDRATTIRLALAAGQPGDPPQVI